jgi:hypothetical protein
LKDWKRDLLSRYTLYYVINDTISSIGVIPDEHGNVYVFGDIHRDQHDVVHDAIQNIFHGCGSRRRQK